MKSIRTHIQDAYQWIRNNKDGVIATATVVIALTGILMFITTLQSRGIQKKGLEISDQLGNLQEEANKQNLVRLQNELRPYLIPKLRVNPPFFTIDGQSVMTFTVHKNHYLVAKFMLSNVGRMPALNVRAKYDSPGNSDVDFDLAENVILPETRSQRYWSPWVNIQSVVGGSKDEPFEVVLTIEYDGNEDIDKRRYLSVLRLEIQKDENGGYKLINQDLKFQFE